MYDYLIVGAGLFGSVLAREMTDRGKRCVVLEKSVHLGGMLHTSLWDGIHVHCYGPHIFHTDDRRVWEYVNRFAAFKPFVNTPLANYKGEIYNLPFNMHTFEQMWGVTEPAQARARIEEQCAALGNCTPRNLEQQAISLVGTDIYERLIKGYTEKQWGRDCKELPPEIIKRLPVRFRYDNNYYDDRYQGVPAEGYTAMIRRMLEGTEVLYGRDYLENKTALDAMAHTVIYTGPIDAYFGYSRGRLAYRSLRFEHQRIEVPDYQGNAVVNYTDAETPYTRVIEHKHFTGASTPHTVITREYPAKWDGKNEPYYPIADAENLALYARYRALAEREKNVLFGGRLAEYKYYDMDEVVLCALELAKKLSE